MPEKQFHRYFDKLHVGIKSVDFGIIGKYFIRTSTIKENKTTHHSTKSRLSLEVSIQFMWSTQQEYLCNIQNYQTHLCSCEYDVIIYKMTADHVTFRIGQWDVKMTPWCGDRSHQANNLKWATKLFNLQ